MSILQEWVADLGLRYQGVLMSAVRGCDTAPKADPSKDLVRCYRAEVLRTHVKDPRLSKSFIEKVDNDVVAQRMSAFVKNWDHYPMHYVMHLVHASQIVGFYHSDATTRLLWADFYKTCCHKMHMTPEDRSALSLRLEADEDKFFANQDEVIKAPKPQPVERKDPPKCRHCRRVGCIGHCLGT